MDRPPPRHPQVVEASKRRSDVKRAEQKSHKKAQRSSASISALAQAALLGTAHSAAIRPDLSRSQSEHHNSTLRRRASSSSSSSESSSYSLLLDGAKHEEQAAVDDHEALEQAIKELEQIELAEFISRSSKQVTQVDSFELCIYF